MTKRFYRLLAGFIPTLLFILPASQAQIPTDSIWSENHFKGIALRSIGPALMSGRIADIAIHPEDESTWYVAVGSGGLWKTTNNGISWQSLFDDQGSYSTGAVTIDPNNPSTIWLGTGENVGGRHVGYGDGIYRSTDGGQHWQNMGLKKSEHIAKIVVHPENSNVIWVAAQGPLWSKGGERGLYKSSDGGKSWQRTLGDDQWTGVTDLLIDPRNPDRLYAATWQRHRTIAAYLGGGPKSALYRSEDGGNSWIALTEGLPESNLGKTGLALSPQNPDVIYAAIEEDHRKGGLYKSTDRGNTWSKQSEAVSGATGPHYYQELYASPHHEGRLYLMDVRAQISNDGGKTFTQMPEKFKHSDNHAMAFRPSDPDYLLVGTDGGLYESYDQGENWRFINNMPITQFYKLAVDDARPFYHVYGGTQDNYTQMGPSQTDNLHGIQNSDWEVVLYADGHQPATEPGNPNIAYAQWQQGNLTRIDRATGEITYIRPQPAAGEVEERYNWDAPILVSPHSPTRLYHGSQRLWRSDDRGDSWTAISPDLTKNQSRIELPIMGRKQSWDNPWDFYAMSNFNTITSIAESPLKEGLIYTGTDDGLIQKTNNGGENWQKIAVGSLPGAPATAYVNDIKADLFDINTLYVALDNHKHGDYKPYLYKSTNGGSSWQNIGGSLPARHLVWRLVQDHENKNLLFIGTEFGVFFSTNGGSKWIKLKGNMPNIPVRDLTIQRHENDLVVATFGRSFYILDDISVFRQLSTDSLKQEAQLFNPADAWWYIPRGQIGFDDRKGSQGEAHFVADNPPFGAVFTYHLSEDYQLAASQRKKKEEEIKEQEADIAFPGWEAIGMEEVEDSTRLWLTVSDQNQQVIRKIRVPITKGFHRVAWDLRYPSPQTVQLEESEESAPGMLAPPGKYFVQLQKEDNGKLVNLSGRKSFSVNSLFDGSIKNPREDQQEQFWRRYEKLQRETSALNLKVKRLNERIRALEVAYENTTAQDARWIREFNSLNDSLQVVNWALEGNPAKRKVGEQTAPTLYKRMSAIMMSISHSRYGATQTALQLADIIESELEQYQQAVSYLESETKSLAGDLREWGGPYLDGF